MGRDESVGRVGSRTSYQLYPYTVTAGHVDTPRRLLKTPPSDGGRSGNVPQTLKSEEFSELYYSEVSRIVKKCVRGAFQGGPRQAH